MVRVGTTADSDAMEEGPVGYQLSDGTVLNVIDGDFEISGGKRHIKTRVATEASVVAHTCLSVAQSRIYRCVPPDFTHVQ